MSFSTKNKQYFMIKKKKRIHNFVMRWYKSVYFSSFWLSLKSSLSLSLSRIKKEGDKLEKHKSLFILCSALDLWAKYKKFIRWSQAVCQQNIKCYASHKLIWVQRSTDFYFLASFQFKGV